MLLKLLKPTAMRRVTPLLNQNINSRLAVNCIRDFRSKAEKYPNKIPNKIEHNDRVRIDSSRIDTRQNNSVIKRETEIATLQNNSVKKRDTEIATPQNNSPISRVKKRPKYKRPKTKESDVKLHIHVTTQDIIFFVRSAYLIFRNFTKKK